ncbi:MAG: hypothetical protein LBK23_08090, partial [Oscillospiraceae bacterium]|nr:hypothetical protein [Oscillospiraceae bacterium]
NSYAYNGQIVNQMAGTDADGVKGLLTGGQLARQDIWLNKIQTGGNWNYAPLAQTGQGLLPSFPHVRTADGSGEVWGQTDIPLPGQGGAMTLLINGAEYKDNKYSLSAIISHPERASADIIALLSTDDNGTLLPNNIELDGMEFDASNVKSGAATYLIGSGIDGTTVFTITTNKFDKALDKYRLTVTIGSDTLSAQVDYGQPNYWTINNLSEWNQVIQNHGKTSENFRIAGEVDFSSIGNGATQYNGLKIGRLESDENVSAATGFKGLRYAGGSAGTPWIETILQPVKGLSFNDMQFDFSSTTIERGVTGAIITAPNILDCELSKVYIMVNAKSAEKSGFISNITDTAENVKLDDVRLTATGSDDGNAHFYTGALCAVLDRGFYNIEAKNVTVDMSAIRYHYYVGGIIGGMNNFGAPMTQTAALDNVTVKGYHVVGGFCGAAVYKSIVSMEAKNLNVEAMYGVAGLMQYVTGYSENITVSDSTVKSTLNDSWTSGRYEAGGVMMYSSGWGNQIKNVLVDNVKVSGGFLVGAYCGYLGSTNVYDLEVVNCTVTGNTLTERSGWPLSDLAEKYGNIAAGGVAGIGMYGDKTNYGLRGVTVRNTAVTGMFNVGGLYGSGFTEGGLHASQAFIAEDVTVTATRSYSGGNGRQLSNAGGAVGRAFAYSLTDIACGATVSAPGEAVGGLIGLVETGGSTALAQSLTTSYFAGKATGSDRVGGILGLYNSASVGPTAANISNVLVAANVYGTGNKVSLWFNNNASNGSAGDAKVYIWDQSLVSGQTAAGIKASADALKAATSVIPEHGELVEADDFAKKDFYTNTAGFESAARYWSFDNLSATGNKFMPYTMYYDTAMGDSKIQHYAGYKDADGNVAAGIPLPAASNPAQAAVYASGVSTVNIEVPGGTTSTKVTVNSTEYTLDDNGVVTLENYDFTTKLTVSISGESADYEAKGLARSVMTFGTGNGDASKNYWYYIQADGTVKYGNGNGPAADPGTVSGITSSNEVVHLWQGKALCADGTVYVITGGDVDSGTKIGTALSKAAQSVPFWQYTVTRGASTTELQVFHSFTLIGNAKVDTRVFALGNTLYSVAPEQGAVYDGVVLSSKNSINGTDDYFALLSGGGELQNYKTALYMNGIPTDGITQLAGNLGSDGTILVARYNGGEVAVLDYTKSTSGKIEDTHTTAQQILSFVGSKLKSLGSSLLGGSNIKAGDAPYDPDAE